MKTLVKTGLILGLLSCINPLYAGETGADEKTCKSASDLSFLNHEFGELHRSTKINLCKLYNGKPMLIVNTASHCGKTKQFGPLKTLDEKYKNKGLQIIGFTSNDFNQAAKNEEEAASICYDKFGVDFTMLSPTNVKGKKANDVFAALAKKSGEEPSWNFNKYLVSFTDDGKSVKEVKHYDANHQPLGDQLEADLAKELGLAKKQKS